MSKRAAFIFTFFLFISVSSSAQWTRISSNDTSFYYYGTWFLNKDTGFVCGSYTSTPYNPIALRTKNGGSTWDTTVIISTPGWYPSIKFVNDSVGYIGGQDGNIFKTFDMGNTWQWAGECTSLNDMQDLFFKTIDTGFVYSLFGGLYKYDTIPSLGQSNCTYVGTYTGIYFAPYSGSLRFLDSQNGYLAGSYGDFARTSDGGNTWQSFNGDSSLGVLCAWMSDTSHGVMAGEYGMISVTNNGGATWSLPFSISSYCITDISFVNNQKGYAVGGKDFWGLPTLPEKGIIWKTLDGGYTWTVDDSSWNESIAAIFIVNDSLAYAVGKRGLILKNTSLFNSGINENIKTENNISLSPNPATSEIRIETASSKTESIEIYDVLGQKVFSQQATNGKQQTMNVSAFPSGIYFVKVKTEKGESVAKFVKE